MTAALAALARGTRARPALILGLLCGLTWPVAARAPAPPRSLADYGRDDFGMTGSNPLEMPAVGSHRLRILASAVLELTRVSGGAGADGSPRWEFAGPDGAARLPAPGAFRVSVDGHACVVKAIGFKRRALYAPLARRDLRARSDLYLELQETVGEGATVEVENPDATLWNVGERYRARAERLRWGPAIHVNQVGYAPTFPKQAMVGYSLGSLGELKLPQDVGFQLVDADTGKAAFEGRLRPRQDRGFELGIPPYERVFEADFSAFRRPGVYRLAVPGCGASLPFLIDDGVAAAFARTYALGIYHQRCGAENGLPFTRFTHAPCHMAPAAIPTLAFRSVQDRLAEDTRDAKSNPRHTAPALKDVDASLYAFVNRGTVDASGGHHDAGDYSKYAINSAQFIHALVFAADALEGAGELDNLGLPESADGKSDLLQLAKWEADFLSKMQDADGGFYFLVYPRERRYENNVLPDRGDPQVVYPKTTAVTAAATAALAQAGSSPRMKAQFPEAARLYSERARKGWAFLQAAIARHGRDGAYQKITHYGDTFMHDDELAWAATEMFLATGSPEIHARLREWFDPSDPRTRRYTWQRLFEGYGCAARSYAFAARTGRIPGSALDPGLLSKCERELRAGAVDQLTWARNCAYGTSFPTESKRFRAAGWYFPMEQAFDLAAGYALDPRPELLDGILTNLNFEGGANPSNVTTITGLGWRRPRELVNQYAQNDRRVLPPSGIPESPFTSGFTGYQYGRQLAELSFPPDDDRANPFPMYDRWADTFNTTGECVTAIQARGLAVLASLMARTPMKQQPWRSATARIAGVPPRAKVGSPVTAQLEVDGLDAARALIVWEADAQEPVFGARRELTIRDPGKHWIEAEAQWPDGRRAFATLEFEADRD